MKLIWRSAIVIALLLPVALMIAFSWFGLRYNATSSAPVGIWRITEHHPQVIHRGEYVFVCPPAHPVLAQLVAQNRLFKGRCGSGTVPFIKRVVAIDAGVRFSVSEAGVLIDDELLANTAPYPWPGLTPAAPQSLADGEFVAIQTQHVASIDSRYFGPLKTADVIGRIEPLWTY